MTRAHNEHEAGREVVAVVSPRHSELLMLAMGAPAEKPAGAYPLSFARARSRFALKSQHAPFYVSLKSDRMAPISSPTLAVRGIALVSRARACRHSQLQSASR